MKKLLFFFLMFLSAGAFSQTVTNTVILDGSGSTDSDGTISAYLWTKVSGPTGGDIITNATSAKATVVYTLPGIYVYSLVVTDNSVAKSTNTATTQITVLAANIAPHAIITPPSQTIQLPAGTTGYNNQIQIQGSPMQSVKQNSKLIVKQIQQDNLIAKSDQLFANIMSGINDLNKTLHPDK